MNPFFLKSKPRPTAFAVGRGFSLCILETHLHTPRFRPSKRQAEHSTKPTTLTQRALNQLFSNQSPARPRLLSGRAFLFANQYTAIRRNAPRFPSSEGRQKILRNARRTYGDARSFPYKTRRKNLKGAAFRKARYLFRLYSSEQTSESLTPFSASSTIM